jgi:hypothetical protein
MGAAWVSSRESLAIVQDKEGTGIATPEVKLATEWRKEPHVPPPRRPDVKFEDYSFVLSHPHMRVRVHV